jgi:poly(A) polymerase
MTKFPLYEIVPNYALLSDVVQSSGDEVFLVGGAIRDYLINLSEPKPTHPHSSVADFDFVVFGNDNSQKLAEIWATAISGTLVILDDVEKIYRVVSKKTIFDFSSPKGKDHKSDAKARDFTMNSLSVALITNIVHKRADDPPYSATILDPTKMGLHDIKNKIIREADKTTFIDDPLRLVRTFRFMATLPGFKIDKTTLQRICRESTLVTNTAKERLRDEFVKLFSGNNSYISIVAMDDSGLLNAIFPETNNMKGVTQNRYHTDDVWGHSLSCLKGVEAIVQDPRRFFPSNGDLVMDYLNRPTSGGWHRYSLLKFVALFHDVGKPETKAEKIDLENKNSTAKNEATFYGHENRGAQLFKNISKRIILGKNVVRIGAKIIKNHMRLLSLATAENTTERAIARLVRDLGEETPGLLILGVADTLAGKSDTSMLKKNQELINRVFATYKKMGQPGSPVAPLLTGSEIMTALNIEEGTAVGQCKSELLLAQATGVIKTKEEAISYLKDFQKRKLEITEKKH